MNLHYLEICSKLEYRLPVFIVYIYSTRCMYYVVVFRLSFLLSVLALRLWEGIH